MVATVTEACTVSKRAVCILLECFLVLFLGLVTLINKRENGELEKYKGQEAAWVEQIKICGDDTGKQPLQKACIVLRIEVIHYDI